MNEEQAIQEWVARKLENWPPLTERQKSIIRTAFAAHRATEPPACAA